MCAATGISREAAANTFKALLTLSCIYNLFIDCILPDLGVADLPVNPRLG
jgi:hypothetical protein